MLKRWMLIVMLMGLVLSGCSQATPEPTEPPATEAATEEAAGEASGGDEVVLTVEGIDGATKALTMSELKELPAYEGWGGRVSSTGRITPPEKFTGVTMQTLADLVGGLQEGQAVRVIAEDGYAMTHSYDQVMKGDYIVYDPGTGEETTTDDPLRTVLVYEMNGEPLPEREDGKLRTYLLNSDQQQVTDGHWSVKFVNKIAIKSMAEDWTVHLEGTITEEMDRSTFESGASPNCHQATWEDPDGQVWEGIPLWLLVGRVDDDNKHEDDAFADEMADAGYDVDIVAADGYKVTLDIGAIVGNKSIIVAYLVDGSPLEEKHFPLRLVGPGLDKGEMVGQIAEIIANVEDVPVEAEATEEPEASEEETGEGESAAGPACDGALNLYGNVNSPQCLTLNVLKALGPETLTIEHPKKGEQEYTGLRLNAVLDLAEPADDAEVVRLFASDGYNNQLFLDEVRACEECLLAIGEDDTLSAVMPGFDTSFWVKDVVSIEVE